LSGFSPLVIFRQQSFRETLQIRPFTLDCELPFTCAIGIHAETQGGQMRSTESLGDVIVIYPLDPEDGSAIIPIRTARRTQKGVRWRIDARKQFDTLMEAVSPPDDVTDAPRL
jgi:hypothetical protein